MRQATLTPGTGDSYSQGHTARRKKAVDYHAAG